MFVLSRNYENMWRLYLIINASRLRSFLLLSLQILVAPVLDHGVRERNVYLPKFEDDADDDTVSWKRGTDGTFYKGGKWLNGTKVPLSDVLYFVRQKSDTLPGLGQVWANPSVKTS